MLWPSSGRGHGVRLRVLGAVLGVAKFPRALLTAKCVAYFGFEPESAESDLVSPSVAGGGNLSE